LKSLKLKTHFVILLCLSFIGCKTDEFGKGGKAQIYGYVEFTGNFKGTYLNNVRIYSNTNVYMKYGATSYAGSDVTQYDTLVTADVNGNYDFGTMYEGDYYLLAVGNYLDAQNNSYPMTGGLEVKITSKKQKCNYNIGVGQ
jgi:hypothetical protein